MSWTAKEPVRGLPEPFQKMIRDWATMLFEQLKWKEKLEVGLVPAPEPKFEGHCIRVAFNHNPDWYRNLYHTMNFRRNGVLASLKRIANDMDKRHVGLKYSFYDYVLRQLIIDQINEGLHE